MTELKEDQNLILEYFKGDEKSLEILIQKYLKPIYGFIYRYVGGAKEAEDITQEVFVRVWRNLKKPAPYRIYSGAGFNPKKGSFKTWIFSIAKNAAIDSLRKKKALPFSEFDDDEGGNVLVETIVDPSPLPLEILERKDLTQLLEAAMQKLPMKYRMVLALRYNDHFTFQEIAETLAEPPDTVKSRHRRALILLKKIIGES
jgi:RNA polymerase sigma-70 factor (ECF subfamily)